MAMKASARRLSLILAILLLAVGVAAAHRAWGLLHIGVAYKAKMLCSATFVSKRPLAVASADLAVDDLSLLRHVDAQIEGSVVSATLLGLISYEAVYRVGLGCTLLHEGFVESASPVVADIRSNTAGSGSSTAPPPVEDLPRQERLNGVMQWAFSEPDPAHLRRTYAVLVMQDGKVVAERYAPGIDAQTPLLGWSMTKSVVNALVAVLVAEGKLDLGDSALVPAWRQPRDPRRRITLDHLLRMNSGLAFNEDASDPLQDVTYMLMQTGDMAAYAADKQLQNEPGREWRYSSGTTNILSGIIRRTVGDGSYLTFPSRVLFEPLGMRSAVIEPDAAGTFVGSSFMYATARDWAKFGQLYLQDGVWGGRRLLPAGWVKYTTTPAPNAPDGVFGAHFWLKIPPEYRSPLDLPLPNDAFHAVGHEGQFLTIIPSQRLVIVRLGLARYPQAWEHDRFVDLVLQAMGQ